MATQDQLDAKRRRVSRACDTCRRKKVRCDGLQPSCTNCSTFGFQCTFNDSAKKRGPPKGYIEALENRLHRMENLLGGLVHNGDRPKVDFDTWTEEHDDDDLDSLDSMWPPSPDTSLPNQDQPSSGRHRDSVRTDISRASTFNSQFGDEDEEEVLPFDLEAREKINAISENLSSLTLDDGGFLRYLGNSSGIDMLQRNDILKNSHLLTTIRMKEHRDWLLQKEGIIAQMESEMPMPPRDLAEHLIDLYFSYVHPNMPVLHKPTFMRQYRNADPHQRPARTLLNAMFAIASRFSHHPEIVGSDPEAFGDEYFDRAKRLIDFEYELPRQSSIQALLLMVVYRYTSAKSGGRVWVMMGMATRMAQDLGMHRNSARWHLPPLETEIRKRLWWACYIMDRWVSACMGRPIAIDDSDCDVDYPSVVEQDWADPDGSGESPQVESNKLKEQSGFALRYFVESIKLSQILGKVLQRVYSAQTRNHGPGQVSSTVAELDTMLTKWLLALPPDLKYDHRTELTGSKCWVAAIHISYYSVLILLHRPSMVPSSLTKTKLSESMPSLNICISAANSVTHLAGMLIQEDSLKYVWCFTTYDLFLSSLIHLTNSASLDMRLQMQARKNLVKMIAYMKSVGDRWFNSGKFAVILEDLMCAHLNFDEYKSDSRQLESFALMREDDYLHPIVLRDQYHPSGGTLLFSPKVIGTPQTPPSTTSTPSSSPSTPSIQNPDFQEVKQEPMGPDHGILQNIYQNNGMPCNSDSNTAPAPVSSNAANHSVVKPRKSRRGTSQRKSLLFQTSQTSSASGSGQADQPMITFSSLSTPGMFTQGQAFVDYGQMVNLYQQQQTPHQPQPQSQPEPQPQSQPRQTLTQHLQQHAPPQHLQPQQSHPAQPFSVTPLLSSPLALQERGAQQQQVQQHQQLLQQQQQEFLQQQQFIQQHQLNMRLQEQQKQAQQQQNQQQQYNSQCGDHQGQAHNSQNNLSNGGYVSDTGGQENGGGGTATPTETQHNIAAGTVDYSSLSLFPAQELGQDSNLMAVPNPFFGIPNTIDWDEWNQYIANAGLQKL